MPSEHKFTGDRSDMAHRIKTNMGRGHRHEWLAVTRIGQSDPLYYLCAKCGKKMETP